jgi:hypothetical protein
VIARIVHEQWDPQETILRSLVPGSVRADDVEGFVRLVQRELKSLNPDNVVRFGVRPIEFERWQRQHRRQPRGHSNPAIRLTEPRRSTQD